MKQSDCDHNGFLRYARRTFSNGTVHYCVQCQNCRSVVKTKKHGGKLFIKHSEVPTGYQIHEFMADDAAWQGGLFDE